MHPGLTLSVIVVLQALQVAEQSGFSGESLCRHAGIDPAILEDLDARIPTAAYQVILAEVARLSGDEYFWLSDTPEPVIAANNALFYLVFNAPDMEEFAERSRLFYGFLSDAYYPEPVDVGEERSVRVSCHQPAFPLSGHRLDLLLSRWYSHAVRFAGPALRISRVRLPHRFRDRRAAYEQFFKVPVDVDQPCAELVGPVSNKALLNRYQAVDPHLDSILLRYLGQDPILNLPRDPDLVQALRAIVQQELPRGIPAAATVAAKLHVSVRTLQRKLGERGSSYSGEVEKLRRHLALDYLAQEKLTISEVAFMLGFRDPASFSKAFRKWHNATPTEFRRARSVVSSLQTGLSR